MTPVPGSSVGAGVQATGVVADALSGVAAVGMRVDSGAARLIPFDAAGRFSVPTGLASDGSADGVHVVWVWAADRAGNVSAPVADAFYLDTRNATIK